MDIYRGKRWVITGLAFGVWMIVFMQFIVPPVMGEEIVYDNLYFNIPWLLMFGIGWGYYMKRNQIKKNQQNK